MVATQRVSDNSGKQRRVLVERALTAAKQGEWEIALTANRSLLQLAPSAEVHNRVGKALSELGRFQEAYQAYQRAAEFDPHNSIAQRNLRRLEQLKGLPDEPGRGHPLARSSFFIEETGKTALASLVRPAEHVIWRRIMPGDPLVLRIDEAAGIVNVHSLEGAYVGQIEPRIGERIIELSRGGNRYAAAVVDHEADTLRVILREIYQDPSLSDRLSFPTRVRSTAPRAYIRKDILFDDTDLLSDDEESDEPLAEEAEEEPELEDEEFTDDDLDDSGV